MAYRIRYARYLQRKIGSPMLVIQQI
uniref:Uncharacterized protein n=1 Tax=Tetranychus urticae TaxID=32264 RepID=T1L2X8_TETUR